VHAEVQPEQGALDVAETFLELHALPVDGHHLVRQCRAIRQIADQHPGLLLGIASVKQRLKVTSSRQFIASPPVSTPWPCISRAASMTSASRRSITTPGSRLYARENPFETGIKTGKGRSLWGGAASRQPTAGASLY